MSRNKAMWSDVIGLLHKQDRTVAEICELTGLFDVTVRAYLNALLAEGVVIKGPRRGTKPVIWQWKHRRTEAVAPALHGWLTTARQALDEVERMAA
jgi:DNA-binding IclR family transcriptional regulator